MIDLGRAAPVPAGERASLVARRLAFQSLFEGEFGSQTATQALDRLSAGEAVADATRDHALAIVTGVVAHRSSLDAEIARRAPAIPVSELGRVERSILRSALFELLYSAAASGSAVRDAVSLARTYAGDAASRLVGGVLRSVTKAPAEGDEG